MTTQEKADWLVEHATGEKVKGKLQELIALYEEQKENPHQLLDIKDEFNQLSFYLGEIVAKAKDVQNRASIESQNAFNSNFLKERNTIDENGRKKAVETAKYNARLLTSTEYITEAQAELAYIMIRGYNDTCVNYRNAATQRLAVLRDEQFSSRQQV